MRAGGLPAEGRRDPGRAAGAHRRAGHPHRGVRGGLCARHYSARTEDSYVGWIRRFVVFHDKRHPAEWARRRSRCLRWLAVDGHVAASTQNQVLSALLFLYRDVLEIDLPWLRPPGVERADCRGELTEVLPRWRDVRQKPEVFGRVV